jgi:hypothetical protein
VALPPDSRLHHGAKYCQQNFAGFNLLLLIKIWGFCYIAKRRGAYLTRV